MDVSPFTKLLLERFQELLNQVPSDVIPSTIQLIKLAEIEWQNDKLTDSEFAYLVSHIIHN